MIELYYWPTPNGKKRQQEIDRKSKQKFRETLEGQEKQHEIDRKAKNTFRSTPEGKKIQQEIGTLLECQI